MSSTSLPDPPSTSSYFSYPVTHVVSGLYRRFTDKDPRTEKMPGRSPDPSSSASSASPVFTPVRTASPFQPPPLTPLTLSADSPHLQQQLLSRALAEEIRLLVPARLQLVDTWRLAYSLDRDGASLATLYDHCREFSRRSPRAGYVLVIREASPTGAVFGAYMTDPPHPASHYYATGECFLWRANVLPPPQSVIPLPQQPTQEQDESTSADENNHSPLSPDQLELAGLPPPPSADTTHVGRSTTLRGERKKKPGPASNNVNDTERNGKLAPPHPAPPQPESIARPLTPSTTGTGASTPERIRFKAFPYSGVNDYMMFCETGFLSLGGGDGHYGLWMDSSLEKGVSQSCQTFGNEPLSDEGVKFDILGAEVWYVGS